MPCSDAVSWPRMLCCTSPSQASPELFLRPEGGIIAAHVGAGCIGNSLAGGSGRLCLACHRLLLCVLLHPPLRCQHCCLPLMTTSSSTRKTPTMVATVYIGAALLRRTAGIRQSCTAGQNCLHTQLHLLCIPSCAGCLLVSVQSRPELFQEQ